MKKSTGARLGPAAPPLVIAAALSIEVRALRRGAASALVVRTGMGPARSRRAVPRLMENGARALAVAGVSGSLDPALRPGDIVVASSLSGLEAATEGDARPLDSAGSLLAALERLGRAAVSAPLLSVDHLVRGGERERLRERGVCLVDMESAWLAEAANGRPLAVLRVIVDAPGNDLVSLSFLRHGIRALRALRSAVPALEHWARDAVTGGRPPALEESPEVGHLRSAAPRSGQLFTGRS